jgi:hypothetical protein
MSSCGGTKKEAQEENGWTSLTEEQRDFWTKFDNDLYFQKEHIKEPLPLEIIEIDEEPRTEFLERRNLSNCESIWLYRNAEEPTEFSHEYKAIAHFSLSKGVQTLESMSLTNSKKTMENGHWFASSTKATKKLLSFLKYFV